MICLICVIPNDLYLGAASSLFQRCDLASSSDEKSAEAIAKPIGLKVEGSKQSKKGEKAFKKRDHDEADDEPEDGNEKGMKKPAASKSKAKKKRSDYDDMFDDFAGTFDDNDEDGDDAADGAGETSKGRHKKSKDKTPKTTKDKKDKKHHKEKDSYIFPFLGPVRVYILTVFWLWLVSLDGFSLFWLFIFKLLIVVGLSFFMVLIPTFHRTLAAKNARMQKVWA